MSDTPIIDFVNKYAESGTVRAHMPGHKGRHSSFLGDSAKFDITEIAGADELYGAKGIIRQSEENASALFGTGATFYSCEGSSLAIRAMLYLAFIAANERRLGNKAERVTVLAGRNAHKTLISAAALMDLDVEWLRGEGGLLSFKTDIRALDDRLAEADEGKAPLPAAVYITSPDYLGNMEDIRRIAAVCHWHGVPLLVDNAHGAYLKFLEHSLHPIDLGADMCSDSAHKTLPCLTGAAYLHIHRAAERTFFENAERALGLFASTSPSYLILRSLDAANVYAKNGYRERLFAFIEKVEALKTHISSIGFELAGNEPIKLTVKPKGYGYTGTELAEHLRKNGVECEFSDPDHTVLMLTEEIGDDGLAAIRRAFDSAEPRAAITELPPSAPAPERVMSIREAVFSPQQTVPRESALGRVIANDHVSCPPAVPVAAAGERISEDALRVMRYYGVEKCTVVK